jgi:hypothetical protein
VVVRRSLLARNAKIVVTSLMALAAGVAGCAAIAGINDGASVDKPAGDAATGGEAGRPVVEGGATTEGGVPCVAKTAPQPTGVVFAHQATTAPAIDGTFDEWACVDRIDMGQGVVNKGMPAGAQRVEFAMQWTPTDLYFYAHPITTAPGFDNAGTQIFANDSVHLIIGRDPPPTTSGAYRTGDHQLTFDYKGRFGDYVNGSYVGSSVAAVTSADAPAAGTVDFQVEARVTALSLGLTRFSAGQKLVINVMLVDATAMNALGFRIWRLPPKATCPCDSTTDPGSCCARIGTQDSPTCDIRCSDSLELD